MDHTNRSIALSRRSKCHSSNLLVCALFPVCVCIHSCAPRCTSFVHIFPICVCIHGRPSRPTRPNRLCQIPLLETSFLFLPLGIARASSGLYGCSCYLGFCLIALPFCVGLEAKQSGLSNASLKRHFCVGSLGLAWSCMGCSCSLGPFADCSSCLRWACGETRRFVKYHR